MTTTTVPTLGGKTGAQWREEAAASRRRSAESWERSDTDGFLSQWASDQMASRYDHLATVAERGYMKVTAYVDLATGEVVKGEFRETKFGSGYAPFEGGAWIFPSSASNKATRERNNAKKGYREVVAQAPALLNSREMRAYPDPAAEWVVTEEED